MDRESGRVDGPIPLDDLARVTDEDEVRDADVAKAHAEGVDPEVVCQLGVARGDVPGDALGEAEAAEEPERTREPLLTMQTLLLHGFERWRDQFDQLALTGLHVFRCIDHGHNLPPGGASTEPGPETRRGHGPSLAPGSGVSCYTTWAGAAWTRAASRSGTQGQEPYGSIGAVLLSMCQEFHASLATEAKQTVWM